ncbi:capsid protein [Paenibacillus sp. 11B]|uniref:capsid protein n=1 Tax=Paenibacillus sp. 11B TaxID=3060965 RepID=UPI002659F233|nr:capsid protein [Paenibacillus sp. 11B]
MGWFQNMVMKILRIQPAPDNKTFTIREPYGYQTNVLRNQLWYRGDASELDQFYKQAAFDSVSKARFWAAVPSEDMSIRKIHSGLPAMIADRLADIVVADLDSIQLQNEQATKQWEEIAKDNDFEELLPESVSGALVTGDGAFKISIDPDVSQYPLIEFYSGDQVEYRRKRGRLHEVVFYTDYRVKEKDYRLEEVFGRGYVHARLLDAYGKDVPLNTLPDTASLIPEITYDGKFLMAVPLMVFKSTKWPGRGKSIFETKGDNFDALDEVVSQWVDAIRSGRVKQYIPEDMVPRDSNTGAPLRPNPFDNQFIKLSVPLAEEAKGLINLVQPQILYEAFVESYASVLDMCLQGVVSPSTLGIDLKKTDNAEAQREKEKATLYTRGKIVDRLNEVIPELVETVLKVYDTLQKKQPGEYEASVKFGEYAAPDFGSVVETVGKARTFGVMSIERALEEMYGDTWTDEEKAEEAKRLKDEQNITFDEPSLKRDDPPDPEDDEVDET